MLLSILYMSVIVIYLKIIIFDNLQESNHHWITGRHTCS